MKLLILLLALTISQAAFWDFLRPKSSSSSSTNFTVPDMHNGLSFMSFQSSQGSYYQMLCFMYAWYQVPPDWSCTTCQQSTSSSSSSMESASSSSAMNISSSSSSFLSSSSSSQSSSSGLNATGGASIPNVTLPEVNKSGEASTFTFSIPPQFFTELSNFQATYTLTLTDVICQCMQKNDKVSLSCTPGDFGQDDLSAIIIQIIQFQATLKADVDAQVLLQQKGTNATALNQSELNSTQTNTTNLSSNSASQTVVQPPPNLNIQQGMGGSGVGASPPISGQESMNISLSLSFVQYNYLLAQGYDCFTSTAWTFPLMNLYTCRIPQNQFICQAGQNVTWSEITYDQYVKFNAQSMRCIYSVEFTFPMKTIYSCNVTSSMLPMCSSMSSSSSSQISSSSSSQLSASSSSQQAASSSSQQAASSSSQQAASSSSSITIPVTPSSSSSSQQAASSSSQQTASSSSLIVSPSSSQSGTGSVPPPVGRGNCSCQGNAYAITILQSQVSALLDLVQNMQDKFKNSQAGQVAAQIDSLNQNMSMCMLQIDSLWSQWNATTASSNGNLQMNDVLNYIQSNGLYVSQRWRISEEDDSGYLYIRDMYATLGGHDDRYAFKNGTWRNL